MSQHDDRLSRIEEAQMFLERQDELLGEHMLALTRAVDQLSRRLDALERRIGGVEERTARPPEPDDATPDAPGLPTG